MKSPRLLPLLGIGLLFSVATTAPAATPPPKPKGDYYGVFRDLPATAVTPQGWLKDFFERQKVMGMNRQYAGYPFDTCMWNGEIPGDPRTDGKPSTKKPNWDRYEQTAYMVDGLYRTGLLLNDPDLKKLGEDNFAYILAHPAADGKLGPANMNSIQLKLIGGGDEGVLNKEDKLGAKEAPTPTQWPFAVMCRALMAYYSATGDQALLDALVKHYLALPANFGKAPRDVDAVEGMCWVYGQTGNKAVLDKAIATYSNFTSTPHSKWALDYLAAASPMTGHGVSNCEATKQPALIYLYTGDKKYLDASVGGFTCYHRDHEMVDGVISSDSGLSGKAPDHEHETCCVSDYSWSLGYVMQASGDAKWADIIESCVLNAGLSVIGKDFKSLQYYDSPNQMVATNYSMTPTVGTRYREHQAYRPDFSIQCCTGNAHRFLPNYADRMWMTDDKGGIVAAFYGPSSVKTTAGADKVPVTIDEKTDYPFDGAIELKVTPEKPVKFPLYVRIPGWATEAKVSINGQPVADKLTPATFYKIDRTFAAGDTVKLDFPMKVRVEKPVAAGISVFRGPLLYVLKIKTDAKVGDRKMSNTKQYSPDFPQWDLTPAAPWNYALLLKGQEDAGKIKVNARPVSGFPWTPDSSPVTLTVPAKKIPAWTLGEGTMKDGTKVQTNPPLPVPPLQLASETEQVELVPDGASMLRIAVFPDPYAAAGAVEPDPTPKGIKGKGNN